MQITRIRIARLEHPLDPPFLAAWDREPRRSFPATLVEVETDEGVRGIGSGDTMDGFAAFTHLFVGQDPLRIARHVRAIETVGFHAGRYWPLEAALWDVAGQVMNQPVAVLFGGAADALPAYASTGERRSPLERAESAVAIAEAGFRAMKLRIDRTRIDEGLATVRAIRDAVGDRLELMVDVNAGWRMAGDTTPGLDVVSARRLADSLAELDVLWLEEPLDGADLRGHATLRTAGRVRIAGGEMTRTMAELLAALDADAFDVYQPDVVLAVGMLRARTIAEVALARNRWFTPHTWTNGIGLLANLHVAAGVGGGPYLEVPYDPPGWTPDRRDFVLAEPIAVDRDGLIHVPSRPGLGIELSLAARAALDASR
ncbi:MAG TPA: mandelate racemase/muconate lactonizing enzyme family protein [Candidatus Limnocylindrales bacterium]|nr:mandelate racemase/muconate lactonizing enzyme family protein [Candidatus Limnocylindrales bacterium]